MIPEVYTMQMGGVSVNLPLVRTDSICLYALNLMGKCSWNHQFAVALAQELEPYRGDYDYIVAVEAKSLALAQELSRLLGHDEYVVLRKSIKVYMRDSLSVDSDSITTKGAQQLYLDGYDADMIHGKRILFLDDVISTGHTMLAAQALISQAQARITRVACIATEGKRLQPNEQGWVRLGHIPLYDKDENPI